jgi:hypothetical protein
MTKIKKPMQNAYTFEEYTRKFFPSKEKEMRMEHDSPDEFGVKLANETLKEIRMALSKKQEKHENVSSFQEA